MQLARFSKLFFYSILDVEYNWHISVHVHNWELMFTTVRRHSVHTKKKILVPFVRPMAMHTNRNARWNRRHAAFVLYQFRQRIVQRLLFVMRIAMLHQPVMCVVQTTNYTAPNVRCEKRTVANTFSLYRSRDVWPPSHSKAARRFAHKTLNQFVVPMVKPTPMNVS